MEHILKIESHQLKNNLLSSYKCLNKLSCDFKQIHNSTVIVDFSNVTFISGNFFSIIGNIFSTYSIENELSIKIANLDRNIANVMCKNGFGKYFKNMKPKRDNFGTVIPYHTFHYEDIEPFKNYITTHVFCHHGMPTMSSALQTKIISNTLEIFANVRDHSPGSTVHSCGQYFPRNSLLRFTISDIGATILENVAQYHHDLELPFSGNGLSWALVRGNSTRKVQEPGGLGFSLIMEFIKLNKGEFSIISDKEGYRYSKEDDEFFSLDYPFPGTIVTMSFNLSDTASYRLKSEAKPKLIF